MSLFKDGLGLIVEMAKHEAGNSAEDLDLKMTTINFDDLLDDMQSIQMGELDYAVEMVVVRENTRLGYDLVELDELAKYMYSNKVSDFKEAIENIAECNGRNASKFAIVIDESAIREAIKEAECCKGADEMFYKAKVEGVVSAKKVLEMLYDKGLNVVKK